MADLGQGQALYAALVPSELLKAPPQPHTNEALFSLAAPSGISGLLGAQTILNSPVVQTALIGVIESLRYEAVVLDEMGNRRASIAAIQGADRIAAGNDIAPPTLDARLDRTDATLVAAQGRNGEAAGLLSGAAGYFAMAIPGSRPVAETALLQAAVLQDEHENQAALAACRRGIALLRNLQLGTSAQLIGPCLDAFNDAAEADAAKAPALHDEMFEAAELAQGSVTAEEIAEAAARLSTSAADPNVARAIRAQQDAQAALVDLYRQRDELTQSAVAGGEAKALAALDKQIAAANARLQQAALAEQAAAPNFGQLVQQVVPAKAVLAAAAAG